jgi:hypothetical protein
MHPPSPYSVSVSTTWPPSLHHNWCLDAPALSPLGECVLDSEPVPYHLHSPLNSPLKCLSRSLISCFCICRGGAALLPKISDWLFLYLQRWRGTAAQDLWLVVLLCRGGAARLVKISDWLFYLQRWRGTAAQDLWLVILVFAEVARHGWFATDKELLVRCSSCRENLSLALPPHDSGVRQTCIGKRTQDR